MDRRFIAHRGVSAYYPENTLVAFRHARENNFNYVECDISFTKDNVPVLLHDNSINRTSNHKGKIHELLLSDLKKYDFGSWFNKKFSNERIPTLKEFLALCKELGIKPYIELKSIDDIDKIKEYAKIIVDIVNELDMETEISFISFSIDYLIEINKYLKSRLGFLVKKLDFNDLSVKKFISLRDNNDSLFIDHSSKKITKKIVNECIKNNISLEVWTVSSKEELNKLDDYISGITCNYYLG